MNKENKVLILVGVFVTLTVALIVFLDSKRFKSKEIILGDDSDNVVFADVGHYGLATAGNNNAVLETGEYIYSLPIENPNITYNWLQIKTAVGSGITYNNFSGSYLHIDGNVKKMIFNYTSKNTGTATRKILIIFPNGKYTLETVTGDEGVIDISDKVTTNEADGWYYVSFINFDENKYLAWGIEAVYENSNLPLRTVELYKLNTKINHTYTSIAFAFNLEKIKNFKLVGAISSYDETRTLAYANLSEGQYQLYERTGNTFRGRDNVHFLKNQIDAERMPSKDLGGALDLFEEELSSNYLGGKTIEGFQLTNNSDVDVNLLAIGLAQDVYTPIITIDTEIQTNERFKTNDKVTIKTVIKNNVTSDGVCAKAYDNKIFSSVDTVLSNVTNIKAHYKEHNIDAFFAENDQDEGRVVKIILDEFDCSSPITLTYDATINDSINNRLEGHIYKINTEAKIKYDIIDDNQGTYQGSMNVVNDKETISSPKRILITANYLEKDTDNHNLADPIIQELFFDDDYVTAPSEDVSDDYELVEIPINYIGTRIENDVTVNYYYEKKKATITTHYIDSETGFSIIDDVVDRKEFGESYSTVQEVITDYDFERYEGVRSGTVKGDVIVTYYYTKKTGTVTVRHVDIANGEDLEPPTITTYKYHETYEFEPKDIFQYYLYDSVEGNPTGEITGPSVTVIFKYRKKTAQIFVYHLIDSTHETLAPRVIIPVDYGDSYTTTISSEIPDNYELKTKTDNFAGLVKENRVEVFYYYQKKDSNLSTSITLDGTKKITSKDDKVTYNISYNATVVDYIGNGTITIVDTLPYKIDTSQSDLNGGVYDDNKKTITWEESWDNINTYENRDSNTINKTIKVLYKDIDATNRVMINGASGKIVLDNNQRSVEDKFKTDVLIPGTILVHHYLVGTHQRVFEDETSTGLSGETYISTAKYKEGYRLVTEKQSQSHVYNEDVTEVVYEYEHLSYDITITNTTEDKGTVSGTEKVYYGEDSTENNIVIKANDGYEIETIVVDGIEITVTDKNEMTLSNFANVKENHKVNVTFTEIEIPVPITGKSNYIWIIAITLIFIISLVTIPKLVKKEK